MTPHERLAYLASVEEQRRASVRGVHVPAKLLTDKERERSLKVRGFLDRGRNPYTADQLKKDGKNLGGSASVSEPTYAIRDDSNRVAELEAKWATRHKHFDGPLYLDDIIMDDPPPQVDKDGLPIIYCSYCGVVVDRVNATRGTGKMRVTIRPTNIDNYGPSFDEKVIVRVQKVTTCPDCCLHLLPTLNRRGEVVNHVKFPETDG